MFDTEEILSILDRCCDDFAFPMLDNGYYHLAATRLSLYRSRIDWAMVIEVFGFSPRASLPDISIQTFASSLHDRDQPERYGNKEAYENYLTHNPHNEFRSVFPIEEGLWQHVERMDLVAENVQEIVLRNRPIQLPNAEEYAKYGIELETAPEVQVFELCRFLAAIAREQILATPQERRVSILPEMQQILQLEEWHHPDLVEQERPSSSETFQQLAQVLATGNVGLYRPSESPNTHWRNWPGGGSL